MKSFSTANRIDLRKYTSSYSCYFTRMHTMWGNIFMFFFLVSITSYPVHLYKGPELFVPSFTYHLNKLTTLVPLTYRLSNFSTIVPRDTLNTKFTSSSPTRSMLQSSLIKSISVNTHKRVVLVTQCPNKHEQSKQMCGITLSPR